MKNRPKNHRPVTRLFVFAGLSFLLLSGLWLGVRFTPQAEAVLYQPLNNQRPKDFAMIRKDGVWHVFAIWCDLAQGCDALRRGFMHLKSTNLRNWEEVGFVLAPDGGSDFDDWDVWAPSIVERDGTYYMFYTGVYKNGSGTYVQKIGLATSTDANLHSWTKVTNPVVDCSTFTWGVYYNPSDSADGAACRDPHVTWDEGEHQWIMTLSARTTLSTPANIMTIALATSENLTTWREYGRIPTLDDYTAESAHRFVRNGVNYIAFTDNCSPQPCVKYVSSTTSPYTGYGAQAGLPTIENNAFASEHIVDHGREYFSRIDGATNLKLSFSELVWTGSSLTIQEISYGSIGDDLWLDTDGDGVHDAGESGLSGVTMRLYVDDGDGLYDPSTDDLYDTKTTGDDPNTLGTQFGYYKFSDVIPGSYWVVVDPAALTSGGLLAGKIASTGNTVAAVTVANNQNVTSVDLGFSGLLTNYDLGSGSGYTLNGATVSNGAATPTVTSAWWDKNYQYRKQITVTAGSEVLTTSHTLDLAQNLNALVSAGKMQADFDDLRLVYWTGSAFIVLNVDTVSATTQRFKVQTQISANASDSNYYLYYGHPNGIQRPAQLAQVYPYYASFNSKDQSTYGTWTESTSSWDIVANRWKFTGSPISEDRFSRDPGTTISLVDDWQMEVTANIPAGQQIAALTFHSQQAFGAEEYHNNFDALNDRIQYYHWNFGQIGTNIAATINTGQDYRLGFSYAYDAISGRTLTSYIDGTQAATALEGGSQYDVWWQASCPCTDKNAYFALGTFNSQASFNDLKGWQSADGANLAAGSEVAQNPSVTATVTPTTSVTFGRLTGFRASSVDQGGSVKFVLSNDGGTSWLYWNGSAWVTSNQTASQANAASEIQAQATSFPSGGLALRWRAILTATGNTQPSLFGVSLSSNQAPLTPNISTPANHASVSPNPTFSLAGTDPGESDNVAYEIQVDTDPGFATANLRTFRQTEDQFGWTGQDQLGNTRYASGTTASYRPATSLPAGTWYWRSRVVDPEGANVYSPYSDTLVFIVQTDLMINDIQVSQVGTTTATISWTLSEAATTALNYGLTTSYGQTVVIDSDDTPQVALSGLTAGTRYHYRLRAVNTFGDVVRSGDLTFTTAASALDAPQVTHVHPTAVVITWATFQPTADHVRVTGGLTTKLYTGSVATTSHRVIVRGLKPKTRYTATVTALGPGTLTASKAFTTLAPAPAAPTIRSASRSGRTMTVRVSVKNPKLVEIELDGRIVKRQNVAANLTTVTITLTNQSTTRHTLRARYTDIYQRRSAWTARRTIP